MANVLALDTSSDHCSVSLHQDGTYSSLSEFAPRKHAHLLLPMVQRVLNEQSLGLQDIDAIAFGCGPGSFTGLRIAAGVVQGLAYGSDCKVVPVSNLKAMALHAFEIYSVEQVLVAIDARMDEVYWSLNELDSELRVVSSISGERVTKPELVVLSEGVSDTSIVGVGSGFEYIERMPGDVRRRLISVDAELRPHAESICRLAVKEFEQGNHCEPAQAAPIYIRDEVAWKKLPGRE